MIWHVSYRKGEDMGFRAIGGRSAAIRVACDYLDAGYDILRIVKNNTRECVPHEEIALSHSKRKAERPSDAATATSGVIHAAHK